MLIRVAHQTDAEEIAKISVNAWRAAYAGIVPEHYLAEISYEKRLRQWYQILQEISAGDTSRIVFVAENEKNQVIGYICGGKNRENSLPFDAELYAIYLEPASKRQSVGTQLVIEFAKWLENNNYRAMYACTLAKNSACRFYEYLGGSLLDHKSIAIFSGKRLVKIFYGWIDLRVLVKWKIISE